jgi:hypothetical protein
VDPDVSARGFPDDDGFDDVGVDDDGFDDVGVGVDDDGFDDVGVDDDGFDDVGVDDDGFDDVGVDDGGDGLPWAVVSVPEAASVSVALVSPRRGVFIATAPSSKRLARPGSQSPAARLGDSGRAVGWSFRRSSRSLRPSRRSERRSVGRRRRGCPA